MATKIALEEHLGECSVCRESLGVQTADDHLWEKAERYLRGDDELDGLPGTHSGFVDYNPQANIQHVLDALAPTDDGFVSVRPCTPGAPATSSLNYTAGVNRANELIAELDLFGNVCIFTEHDIDLIVDVVGYVESGSDLMNVDNARYLETRDGATTFDGQSQGGGKVAAGSTTTVDVGGRGGVPDDAFAAVVNLTVVDPDGPGFLTVDPCVNGGAPVASSLNFSTGVNGANELIADLSADGELCIFSSTGAHLHYEVFRDGRRVNPWKYLGQK